MAIATRPKPKVQHKKRKAQHHSRNSNYLKPYWPYLPMLVIVGLGVLVNNHWPSSLTNINSGLSASALPPTRIEGLVGSQDNWSLVFIILIAGIAAAVFLSQHWFRIKRKLNDGERFMVKHPWFDIALVAVCTVGAVLTRSTF